MAKFLGPRFFLLVLAGVALYTGTTVKMTAEAGNTTTGILANNTTIPITTMQPKLSSSNPTPTAVKSKASTSDSTLTTFTKNLTSPSLIPPTTETSTACNYSLTEGTDGIEVKLSKTGSAAIYITFQSVGHNITQGPWNKTSFTIPFKSLNPCRIYNVIVPGCNPETGTDSVFKTTEFVVTHKVNTSETHGEVCFDTKWNWTDCVQINLSNSCTNYNVTICNKSLPFKLPSVKPVIHDTYKYPPEFTWKNQPTNCKNLTYSCNETTIANVKPSKYYICNGKYDYGNGTITSENITINTTCDLNNPTIISVNDVTIEALWNFNSTNCSKIIENLTWDVNCNGVGMLKGIKEPTQHTISGLKAYNDYNCMFTAIYEKNIIYTNTTKIKTNSSKPSYSRTPTILQHLSHNAFKVDCEVLHWNGDRGVISIEVFYNGQRTHQKNCSEDKCSSVFENLYYLSTYKIKVSAINKNGNANIFEGEHETKYNDKAVLGILSFLIIITSLALLFVLYKIYLLKREKSRNEQELDDLLPTTALLQVEPMSAEALLDAYKKKRADEGRLFMEEFQSIPRIFSNYTVREAKKPENQPKNRYVDILPYDYNRVPLSHGGTDDYINASFIEGYKESNKYIAAQGPKEETVGEFWTMIWEQKSSIIVMVTRCEEGNKNKCAQYWPSLDRETEIFEDLVVKIKGEETCPDYIIRHLTLMNRKEKSAEREVTHIQFTSWPDHGVPTDPGLLLKLRRRVNSFKNFFSGPIVTHCSAGVGRTGTYIGIDAMIESLEAEGRVDIYGYVVKLRRQRCLMVQVEAQYVLIHTALIEYSQFGETEMSLSNFHSEVNTLRQKDGNDPSLIEMEFQKLPKFKNYRSANTARSEENKSKNRSSIVPYDFNRVPIKVNDEASHDSEAEDEDEYSSDEEDEIPTKYINASYVDGYWSSGSFIAAQGPMPDTVVDFLHMLYQKRVKTVFMLTDCTENEKEFCSQYWSDEKKTFGELEVEVKETENCPTYVKRCLEIQHTKRKDSLTLQQYHFLKWAGHELPPKPLDLVDMMKKVREDIDTKNSDVPIVVHCNDGSSRSGVFCALWKLLDAADTEKLVDIFQVAKDLRKARLGVINSQEQYDFLYAALEAAYPVQNGEVKKPAEATEDTVQVINESTALISPITDAAPEVESPKESTDPPPPEEGATEAEASSEPEKTPSENTTNGPTATIEV